MRTVKSLLHSIKTIPNTVTLIWWTILVICQATTWGRWGGVVVNVMKFQLAKNTEVLINQHLSPTLLLGQSVSCILLTTCWIEVSSRFPSSSHTRARPLCISTHTHTHTHTHTSSVSYRHFPTVTQDGINPDCHLLMHKCPNPETSIIYTNITGLELNSEDYTAGNTACSECF